jgi:tetratricopeptide (TPR) repeat protein
MQCPSCGASLPENAQSCPTCGRQFVSASSPERGEQPAAEQATPPQPDVAPVAPAELVYAAPSQPFYSYPSQPLYRPPSQPYFGAPPMVPPPRREPFDTRRFLVSGIPLWAGIVALIAAVATFGLGVFALRKDWADSAWIAAFVALAGAGIILVAGIVLLSLRRFQWLTLSFSALLLVTLSGSGVFALTSQPAVHQLQANALENGKQWQASIREYGLAGEQAPNAPDIARVDLEWGEQLLQQKQYHDAIVLFYRAEGDESSTAVNDRSLSGLYAAYKAWFATHAADVPTLEVAHFFETYLALPACLETCKLAAKELASQAFYADGVAILAQGDCATAVKDYQHVVDIYPGTLSARQASTALAAPVSFTATISGLPKQYAGYIAHLSAHVSPEELQNVQYLSREYAAALNANAQATFRDVRPGKYNFSFDLPPGARFVFWYWYSLHPFDPYSAVVSPLCDGSQTFYYT